MVVHDLQFVLGTQLDFVRQLEDAGLLRFVGLRQIRNTFLSDPQLRPKQKTTIWLVFVEWKEKQLTTIPAFKR